MKKNLFGKDKNDILENHHDNDLNKYVEAEIRNINILSNENKSYNVIIANKDWKNQRDKIIKKIYNILLLTDINKYKSSNELLIDINKKLNNENYLEKLTEKQLKIVNRITKIIYLILKDKNISISKLISLTKTSYTLLDPIFEIIKIKLPSQQRKSKFFSTEEVLSWRALYMKVGSLYGVQLYLKDNSDVYPSPETLTRRITQSLLEENTDPKEWLNKHKKNQLIINENDLTFILKKFDDYIKSLIKKEYSKEEIFKNIYNNKGNLNLLINNLTKDSDVNYLLYSKRIKTAIYHSLIILGFALLKYNNYESLKNAIIDYNIILNNESNVLRLIKYTLKLYSKFSNINIEKWLPIPRPSNVTQNEIEYWIELLTETRNVEAVRRISEALNMPKRTAITIKTYIKEEIGEKSYKEIISKRTKYEKLKEMAELIGIEKTGFRGYLNTPKKVYIKLNEPNTKFLKWLCGRCDKIFPQTPKEVKKGNWCNQCAYDFSSIKSRTSYEEILEIVKFVSVQKTGVEGKFKMEKVRYYKLKRTKNYKFPFQCGACKLKWKALLSNIRAGHWCPKCSQGYMERVCRNLIEKILSYYYNREIKFPSAKLSKIIKNKNIGYKSAEVIDIIDNLVKFGHLDGHNANLNLGIRINGEQHYHFIPYFHSDIYEFEYNKLLDKYKNKLIKNNNIKLFIIPYYEFDRYIQDYIINKLEKILKIDLSKTPRFIISANYNENQKLMEEYLNNQNCNANNVNNYLSCKKERRFKI